MEVLAAVLTVGVLLVYLYLFARSYLQGTEGLNGELFD